MKDPLIRSPLMTGSRYGDLLLFGAILFLMLVFSYRLRVYYRSEPVKPKAAQTTQHLSPKTCQV